MSRLLPRPALDASPRELLVADTALDPRTRALVDQAAADGYRRGLGEGRALGQAAVTEQLQRLGEAVGAAVAAAGAASERARRGQAGEVRALAAQIAAAVIGREPHDGGMALLERVRAALEEVDDAPLQVLVSEVDVELLGSALSAHPDVQVRPDPSLAPGEARVSGRWARVELTRTAAWKVVQEVLDEHG